MSEVKPLRSTPFCGATVNPTGRWLFSHPIPYLDLPSVTCRGAELGGSRGAQLLHSRLVNSKPPRRRHSWYANVSLFSSASRRDEHMCLEDPILLYTKRGETRTRTLQGVPNGCLYR